MNKIIPLGRRVLSFVCYFCIALTLIFILFYARLYFISNPNFTPLTTDLTNTYTSNNTVTLLINGIASTQQRMANIEEADVILLKTFEFHDDLVGNSLVDLLIQKAQKGALIFIQFDVKGNDFYTHDYADIKNGKKNPIPQPLQRLMHSAPQQVAIYPTNAPADVFTQLIDFVGLHIPVDHEKYLITWNSKNPNLPVKVIMGGMNIGDMYLRGGEKDIQGKFVILPQTHDYPWRDTDIELSGEVVSQIVARFYEAAVFQAKTPNTYLQTYLSSQMNSGLIKLKQTIELMNAHAKTAYAPEGSNNDLVAIKFIAKKIHQNQIEQALIQYIKQVPTKETITLIAPYFLPSHKLQEALLNAVSRGVNVIVLSNSVHSSESTFVTVAKATRCRLRSIFSYTAKEKGSFKFYEYLGNNQIGFSNLHEKIWLLGANDHSVFAVGSSNLDAQSLRINSEDMVFMRNASLQKKVYAMVLKDLQASNTHELTDKELAQDPWLERANQCSLDWGLNFVL